MAAAIAAPIVGGLIGNAAASKDRKAMMAAAQAAWAKLDEIGSPPDLSRQIIFQQFQEAGVYEPELLQEIDLGLSQVSQLQERDPSLRQAEMDALRSLQERGQVGLSVEDRVAMNEMRRDVARQSQARTQSFLQDLARRGGNTGGADIMQLLLGDQAGTELASQQADNLARMAAQNALQATASAGQLGGQIRGTDWNQDMAKASAADHFSMADFNTRNQRQQLNVGAQNEAQRANLANKQRIQDQNTMMQNQETLRQQEAKRQYWQDQLDKAGMYAGAGRTMSGAYGDSASQKAGMWKGLGDSIGQGAGTFAQYQQNQPLIDSQIAYNNKQAGLSPTGQSQPIAPTVAPPLKGVPLSYSSNPYGVQS